jgi:hypothetical protein
MRWTEVPAGAWRTPQELIQEGFRRSRVVMLNEAHNGLTRCVRTRRVGRQVLPSAHAMGVRHLAMEALQPGDAEAANSSRRPPDAAGGYLAQPDMRDLIQAALELGWTLWRYEADIDHAPVTLVEQGLMSQAFTNWRDVEQAYNLAGVLAGLPASDRLLVWCGNSHASKMAQDDWTSMGYEFAALVAEEAFVIDQVVTVASGARTAAGGPGCRAGADPGPLRWHRWATGRGGWAAVMLAGGGRPDPVHRQRDDLTGRARPAGHRPRSTLMPTRRALWHAGGGRDGPAPGPRPASCGRPGPGAGGRGRSPADP